MLRVLTLVVLATALLRAGTAFAVDPTGTPSPTATLTPTQTPTETPTATATITPTPTPALTAVVAPGRLAAGSLCLNRKTAGTTDVLIAREGHKTVPVKIVGSAIVTAECDAAGNGEFTTLHLPTGAASSALTSSGVIESDEWCEGGIRLNIAPLPTPTGTPAAAAEFYVSGHLLSTGARAVSP